MNKTRCEVLVAVLLSGIIAPARFAADENSRGGNFRKPADDVDLRYWLENMIWHHRFTDAEVAAATGLTNKEIDAAQRHETEANQLADTELRDDQNGSGFRAAN